MKRIKLFLQNELEYTEYQIGLIRYFLLSILSEISKFFIMGLFFSYISCTSYYLWAICILLILRYYSGGLHFNTYWKCFASSFLYLFLCIKLLPLLQFHKALQLIALLVCIIIAYFIVPVPSIYRPDMNTKKKKFYRIHLFLIIFIYFMLVYILPTNTFLTIGVWVIILHILQLLAAYILRR